MSFKKRLRIRMWSGVFFAVVGIVIIIAANLTGKMNEAAYSFGAIFAAAGVMRALKCINIMRNPTLLEKIKTAEQDEMNIELMHKARSLAFMVYFAAGGLMVAGLYLSGNTFAGEISAYVVCGMTLIYWICYRIVRSKYC